jgi:hypothetical protein
MRATVCIPAERDRDRSPRLVVAALHRQMDVPGRRVRVTGSNFYALALETASTRMLTTSDGVTGLAPN